MQRRANKVEIPWAAIRGGIKFDVDKASQLRLFNFIEDLRKLGIREYRFIRQVPVTKQYPEGISSTMPMDLKNWSSQKLMHFIGSMLHPGIDYVVNMVIWTDGAALFPSPIRDDMLRAIEKAERKKVVRRNM